MKVPISLCVHLGWVDGALENGGGEGEISDDKGTDGDSSDDYGSAANDKGSHNTGKPLARVRNAAARAMKKVLYL